MIIASILVAVWLLMRWQTEPERPGQRYLLRGAELLEIGEYREAHANFERAILADRGAATTYLAVAELWFRGGFYRMAMRRARKAFSAAEEKSDRDVQFLALNLMSECEAEMGNPRAAAQLLERALVLRPRDATTMNNLAYRYALSQMKPDRAVDLARRAVRRRPWNANFIDTLGWAYHSAGQDNRAVRELLRAARLRPDDVTIRRHLAEVRLRVGEKRTAMLDYSKASFLERWHSY